MGWILEGLIEIFMSLTAEVISFCMGAFADFSIDIGYSSGSSWSELFSPSYFKNAEGLLDSVFPVAGNFIEIFMYAGYALVFMILIFKVTAAMFGPMSMAEHPAKVVFSSVIASLGVTYSYQIFIILERIANHFYLIFKSAFVDLQGIGLPNIADFMASPEDLFAPGSTNILSGTALTLIALVLFISLLVQYIRLILEMFERYVMLGALFYTCPLAFSTLASESTKKVFSSWLSMVISQFVLMMMNLFFLGMFYAGFIAVFAPADASFSGFLSNFASNSLQTVSFGSLYVPRDYVFSGAADFLCKMFILIGWLTVGQKVDETLRALGLSASQSGRGLGAALAAGVLGATRIMKSTGNMIRSGGRISENLRRGMNTARANDAAVDRRQKTYDGFMKKPLNDKGRLSNGQSAEGFKDGLKRNSDGTLTKEGAINAVNSPKAPDGSSISYSSKDARSAMNALNLNPDAMSPIGEKPASHSLKDGKFESFDANGQGIRQVGDSERYKADGAFITHNTPAGSFTEPMTSMHIAKASNEMHSALSARYESEGISWTMGTHGDGSLNGTMVGMNKEGLPVYQAALDQVAEMNPARGSAAVSDGTVLSGMSLQDSPMTYSVQNLNDPDSNTHFTPGYDSVKSASSGLYEMSIPEKNEAYMAAKGQAGISRFMKAEDAARDAADAYYPVENSYTRAGRTFNKIYDSFNGVGSTGSVSQSTDDPIRRRANSAAKSNNENNIRGSIYESLREKLKPKKKR